MLHVKSRSCSLTILLVLALGATCSRASAIGLGKLGRVFRGAGPVPFFCLRSERPPTIDGVLDEPVWGPAAVAAGFSELGSGGTKRAFRQTAVRLLYDEQALYLSAVCLEPEPSTIVAEKRKRDDSLWLEDAIELFLKPERVGDSFYHVVINALGTVYDARCSAPDKTDAAWNADIVTAVQLGDGHWSLEAAILWRDLAPEAPAAGSSWLFNVGREHRPPGAPEWSTWMPLEEGKEKFAIPNLFGTLRFVERLKDSGIVISQMEPAGPAEDTDFTQLGLAAELSPWILSDHGRTTELAPHSCAYAAGAEAPGLIASQPFSLAVAPWDVIAVHLVGRTTGSGKVSVTVESRGSGGIEESFTAVAPQTLSDSWASLSATFEVPPGVKRLTGLALQHAGGEGHVWVDTVEIEPAGVDSAPIRDLTEVWPEDRLPTGQPAPSSGPRLAPKLAYGPSRVLFVMGRWLRDAVELTHRVPFHYDLLHCPRWKGKGEHCYALNPDSILRRLRAGPRGYQVIVLAAKPPSAEVLRLIQRAVRRGTGLVVLEPDVTTLPPGAARQAWESFAAAWPEPRKLEDTATLNADLRAANAFSTGAKPFFAAAARGVIGDGKVLRLQLGAKTAGLLPELEGVGRYWDALYLALGRALLCTSRPMWTPVITACRHKRTEGMLAVETTAPRLPGLSLSCSWTSAAFLDVDESAEPQEVTGAGCAFPMPAPLDRAAGLHLATLVAASHDGLADVSIHAVAGDTNVTIGAVKTAGEVMDPTQPMTVSVDLTNRGSAHVGSLTVEHWDALGRLVSSAATQVDLPPGHSSRSLQLPPSEPLCTVQRIVATVADAFGPLDRRAATVFVPGAADRLLDDVSLAAGYVAMKIAPRHLYEDAVGVFRMLGATATTADPTVAAHGIGLLHATVGGGLRHYHGSSHTRQPCPSDPRFRKELSDTVVKGIGTRRKWGYLGFTLADEVHLSQVEKTEVCSCTHCAGGFRDWLKGRYGTVQVLNNAWRRDFGDWAEIQPVLLEDARKQTVRGGPLQLPNIGPWVDFRTFMETAWVGLFSAVAQTAEEAHPDVRLGFTNPYRFGPLSGTNQRLMAKHERYVLKYFGHDRSPTNLQRWQSFSRERKVAWFGYNKSAEQCRHFLWWFALNGGNTAVWWDPFDPWEYGGSRGLVPWHMMDATWRHTARSLAVKEAMDALGSGLGAWLNRSVRVTSAVILHSQESMHTAHALDTQDVSPDRCLRSGHAASDPCWEKLLTSLGFGVRYAATEDLPRALSGASLLVLPYSLALATDVIGAAEGFARAGGTVLADVFPGLTDGRGMTREDLGPVQELFGVRPARMPGKPGDALSLRVELDDHRAALTAGEHVVQVQQLRGCGAKPFIEGNDGLGYGFVNDVGDGRAVCLGLLPTVGRDNAEWLGALLSEVGLRPAVTVTRRRAPSTAISAFAHRLGESELVTVLRGTEGREGAESYKVAWGLPRHAYDVRRGTYLGHRDSTRVALRPGDAAALALLPYRVRDIVLDVPERLGPGTTLRVGVQVVADDAAPGQHLIQVRLLTLAGETRPWHRRIALTTEGRAEVEIPLEHNLDGFLWLVEARDVASGVRTCRARVL